MALNINGTTGISGVDGSASAPALTGTDSNTGINFASDTVNINTGGTVRASINSSGQMGIGKTPSRTLDVAGKIRSSEAVCFGDNSSTPSEGVAIHRPAASTMAFVTNDAERMRLNENGVLILNGTTETTAPTQPHFLQVGQGSNFFTIEHNDSLDVIRTRYDVDTTSSRDIQQFRNSNGLVGKINMTSSTTTFSTSSDYRLKENAVLISDGITRLKTLKPYRFNFKTDASTTVDGFFAHEVTAVPEAITGEKDAVDSEGKIDPQGIDQSKLVPLLTAALQEAVAKIEVLETKVAALEAG